MKIILLLLTAVSLHSCTNCSPKFQYNNVGYGRTEIILDSTTPLLKLIVQLETNNELKDTGKAYWIGYNDLMYSIAQYSDKAIKPLLHFIDTTKNKNSRLAACYTLHLIGIECKIRGRIREEFKNTDARNALLSLLKNDSLQLDIMLLLIRDPWQSDIPQLFKIIKESKTDCWPICNGFLRYQLKDIPLNHTLPESFNNYKIKVEKPKIEYTEKEYIDLAFSKFRNKYKESIIIEDTLLNYKFHIPPFSGVLVWDEEDKYFTYSYNEFYDTESIILLKDITENASSVDYCSIANNFQYNVSENQLQIFSAMTNKQIWINWWNSRDTLYKHSFSMT